MTAESKYPSEVMQAFNAYNRSIEKERTAATQNRHYAVFVKWCEKYNLPPLATCYELMGNATVDGTGMKDILKRMEANK